MQLYRADNQMAVPHTEFPELFAVCRGTEPFLQFQILTLEQNGFTGNGSRHYVFHENDRIRNLNFTLHNYENGRRENPYMVGQVMAVSSERDHYQDPVRVRFEVRRIVLESSTMRIPVLFVDPMSVLPRPKNLIVPLNVERRQREDNHHAHLLQNEVLNPNNYMNNFRIPREYDHDHRDINDYHYFNQMRDIYINDDDSDTETRRRRRRSRVVGSVPHTPNIIRPRGDEPAAASQPVQLAPPPVLSRFTVNAILNQAVLEELTCPISMAKIDKNTAGVTTCQHVFERASITRWLSDHETCPVCRANTSLVQV